MATQRNSTPPSGVIQRVLAFINPSFEKKPVEPHFLQDGDDHQMRPRANTSPASWFADHMPRNLRKQERSASKSSLASHHLSCNLEDIEFDADTVQDDYASSGARPKAKVRF